MSGLRADELARIQSAVAGWLSQVCTITRPGVTMTADGFPGAASTIAADVACRVEPVAARGGGESVGDTGVVAAPGWIVHLAATSVEVKPQDIIVVVGVGTFDVSSTTSMRGVQTDVVARCTKRDAA